MPITPLTRENLQGVWVALLTPWTDSDELDEKRLIREVRSWGKSAVHGLYTGGTTGEFYAQDDDTFERITRVVCDEAHAANLPVQIGCTGLSTRTVIGRIRTARRAGADAIQLAIPFWLELHDAEVKQFFRDIAAAAEGLPLILYHTGRAKRKLSPELLGEVGYEVPQLIGLKDYCDLPTLRQILTRIPQIAVFGGEIEMLDRYPEGSRGTYSAAAGMNPALIVRLFDHCAAGEIEEARPIRDALARLVQEVMIPLYAPPDELQDSAIDRLFRILGGGDVGLRCQGPYRSPTQQHVEHVRDWCKRNTPSLLEIGGSS